MILQPVTLKLAPGQILAVVGPNGSGKSTLLRLLYRFHRPTSGRVLVDGQDIWAMSARASARKVAAVLQESQADSVLSVREIVALGRAPHRRNLIHDRMADADIVAMAMARLDLGAIADRRLGNLSGGERQRVMLARALAQQPQLLVLDEPTNHLDIRHQLALLEMIQTLGVTVICSIHDLNAAVEHAELALLLSDGQPIGFAPPLELLTPDRVAQAFAVKSRLETLSPSRRNALTFHL